MAPSLSLAGRVALVTGGSRGLGRAMALGFAAAGADVAVVGRDRSACDTVAGEVAALGRRSFACPGHVGRWAELDGLVEACYREFGRIDVLVNGAGKSIPCPQPADVTVELARSVVNVNLKGPFRLAVLVGERMRAQGGGSIINVSSVFAVRPQADSLVYSAAKAGLEVVTRGLAQAFAPTVRVNCIRPGPFATTTAQDWSPEERADVAARVGLRRVAEPDEIVGAALLLAGDASSFVTGATIPVDGGWS